MYKFVLDADATIKLAKAGALEVLSGTAACILTQEVYEEVMKGKEKMHTDAIITEDLVRKDKLKLLGKMHTEEETKAPGLGEKSALIASLRYKADALITDDTRFISQLKRSGVKFIIPSDVIVWLVKSGKLTREEGLAALGKLRTSIRKDAYKDAVDLIRGEQNGNNSLSA